MPAQIRCLVTGATGYIGGRLVPRLLEAGLDVRPMARNPDKLVGAPWRDDVEVVRGDLTEPESLTKAFDGADVVYSVDAAFTLCRAHHQLHDSYALRVPDSLIPERCRRFAVHYGKGAA